MGQESELSRLEQFVEKLLARFNDLREENRTLQQELEKRDETIGELRGNLASQRSERGEISERLGKIVAQIEDWEKTLDPESAEEETVDQVTEEEPEALEATESETEFAYEQSPETETESDVAVEMLPEEAERIAEDERRVQHNLFSMPHNRK